MYKEITLTLAEMIKLLSSKRMCKTYLKLLQEHQRQDDEDSNVICLVIDSYEKDKVKYGYKTKSGLWKAIKELNYNDLIFEENNIIYISGMKLVL